MRGAAPPKQMYNVLQWLRTLHTPTPVIQFQLHLLPTVGWETCRSRREAHKANSSSSCTAPNHMPINALSTPVAFASCALNTMPGPIDLAGAHRASGEKHAVTHKHIKEQTGII